MNEDCAQFPFRRQIISNWITTDVDVPLAATRMAMSTTKWLLIVAEVVVHVVAVMKSALRYLPKSIKSGLERRVN